MQQRIYRTFATIAALVSIPLLSATPLAASQAPGGFLEQPEAAGQRPNLTPSEIQAFLPQRGAFTFPAPYSTSGIRLTNATDCGGSDCVNYVGYSYWRNMNNHAGEEQLLVLVGLDRSRGGQGPSLIAVDKTTDEVTNLGPLFAENDPLSWATGEAWYFSATRPYDLYVTSGSKLLRRDVIANQSSTVFDVVDLLGSGHYLWQVHSSADDRVHSATVRDSGNYSMLGCVVYFEDSGQHQYYASQGDFDECQVDKSGDWLLIKEDVDGRNGEDNRIIDLRTGNERVLLDEDGAAGHSDMGHGYMVAADNFANDANTQKLWDFTAPSLAGVTVYYNADWGISAPAHVSHANARADLAPGEQFACGSSVNRSTTAHANEVVCFALDGASNETLVVAPVMTDLDASGGGDSYAKAPKGNLDVTGQYFIWTSNMGGSRLDAFLVKVPAHLISSGQGSPDPDPNPDPDPQPTPEPPPEPTPDPDPTPVSAGEVVWTELVNSTVVGDALTKSGGCDGCPDAGASSAQEITGGDGYLEFRVDDLMSLRYVGLSEAQPGTAAEQIDFAFAIQGGYAEIRENGVYQGDVGLNAGDLLRITVAGGSVSYARNGQVVHTSTATPGPTLRVYATLYSSGGQVAGATIQAGAGDSTDPEPTPEPTPEPVGEVGPAQAVSWYKRSNVRVRGGETLIKTRHGCNGCNDAGASTREQITGGNGYFEFTVDEEHKLRYVGLSPDQDNLRTELYDYALGLQSGYAEVRENGAYRTETAIAAGDVLRIAVTNGVVTYSRNGVVFYTSGQTAAAALRGHAALFTRRSTVHRAVMAATP